MTVVSTGRVSPFGETALDGADQTQSLVASGEGGAKNVVALDVLRRSSKSHAARSVRQRRSRAAEAAAAVSVQVVQVNGIEVSAVGSRTEGLNAGTFLADIEFPIDVAELAGLHDRAFVEVTIRSSGMRKHVEAGLSSLCRFDELEVHTVLVRVVDLDDEYLVVDLLDPPQSVRY